MRKIKSCSLIALSIMLNLLFSNEALSWDNEKTHKDLSRIAAEQSVLGNDKGDYLNKLGFSKGLLEALSWNGTKQYVANWVQDGAFYEDAGNKWNAVSGTARYKNHFHNPLKPWLEAGLTDIQTGESSLLWAQDGNNQQSFLEHDWSWKKVRDFYYFALTSAVGTDRGAYFAQMFRGLGHQMHLIQDASQPDHVRNDAHPSDKNQKGGLNIEPWAAEKSSSINALAANPQIPTLSLDPSAYSLDTSYYSLNLTPVALFIDTDQYNGTAPSIALTQGLAEYANANFASEHTIFAEEKPTSDIHYFPYPRKSSTDIQNFIDQYKLPETKTAEDGVVDVGFWIAKTGDGEKFDHFAKPTYLSKPLEGTSVYYKTFYQDDKCHEDYAKFLIPRAVGYSAALLNYFFRGTLEITMPDHCLYGLIDGAGDQKFRTIKAKIRNTTPNESLGAGTLSAIARYKKRTNYSADLMNDPPTAGSIEPDFSYSVSLPIPISNLSGTAPQEFTFNFNDSPIYAGITDLYLQVVFKGTLGNEVDNAVAVGFKDISEPTHINHWNTSDYLYDSGTFTASTPQERVTINAEYLSFKCTNDFNPNFDANVTYGVIEPGQFTRVITLSDPGAKVYMGVIDLEVVLGVSVTPSLTSFDYTGIINQDGKYDNQLDKFRGKGFHHGYILNAPSTVVDDGYDDAPWPNATSDAMPATIVNW